VTAARHPHDPELTGLVGELTVHSPEFASLWAGHPVQDCAVRYTREFRHPLVGAMTLNSEMMELANDEGQRMAVFTADPDTPSEAALRLLVDLAAESDPGPPQRVEDRVSPPGRPGGLAPRPGRLR
jgi:hypothetical protein